MGCAAWPIRLDCGSHVSPRNFRAIPKGSGPYARGRGKGTVPGTLRTVTDPIRERCHSLPLRLSVKRLALRFPFGGPKLYTHHEISDQERRELKLPSVDILSFCVSVRDITRPKEHDLLVPLGIDATI